MKLHAENLVQPIPRDQPRSTYNKSWLNQSSTPNKTSNGTPRQLVCFTPTFVCFLSGFFHYRESLGYCSKMETCQIGIEVAQQIKLSGCPTKGLFTTKNASLPFEKDFIQTNMQTILSHIPFDMVPFCSNNPKIMCGL